MLYVINTACVIYLKENLEISLKYLLGVLNSKILNFFFSNIFTDYRDVFPIMKSGHIEELPLPNIDFQNKSKKEKHDKIVSLVEQMLESKKKLAEAKTDKDKNYYEQKCNSLDKQIDNLVYELYGLTEEEIKIVEGK